MKKYKSLFEYLFKKVIITGTDGKVYRGYVGDFESAADNEDPEEGIPAEESIGVYPSETADEGIELYESEIADIRIDEQA
ncbi:MAG: hypothetical protein NC084_09705 [Bacteroides sp.]|nr:hypothetical protein [Eubacterium sp.]MCM1419634.1 hypothetical protein [Roseburia sp.]MCM1462972.1 hypothetical protein [Bacteroides sp.]